MIRRGEESTLVESAVDMFPLRGNVTVRGNEGGLRVGGVNKPRVAVDGVSQELVVIPLQVGSGEIHGDTPDIIHRVDVEITKRSTVLVPWREVRVGLFDAIHEAHV